MDAPTVANDANTPTAGLGAEDLLDQLQNLLQQQIELAQQGEIEKVQVLTEKAGSLVQQITKTGALQCPQLQDKRRQLQKLYHRLTLTATAHRAQLMDQLGRIRAGRKTLRAYRASV